MTSKRFPSRGDIAVVDGLGDANCAGLGERLEPSGDVDAIAKDVVPIDNDVAQIDTDP